MLEKETIGCVSDVGVETGDSGGGGGGGGTGGGWQAAFFLIFFFLFFFLKTFRCRSFLTYPDRLRLPDERLIFVGTENELSIPVRIEYVVRCLLAGRFVLETSLNKNRIRT
jgi:hypothetical protein